MSNTTTPTIPLTPAELTRVENQPNGDVHLHLQRRGRLRILLPGGKVSLDLELRKKEEAFMAVITVQKETPHYQAGREGGLVEAAPQPTRREYFVSADGGITAMVALGHPLGVALAKAVPGMGKMCQPDVFSRKPKTKGKTKARAKGGK